MSQEIIIVDSDSISLCSDSDTASIVDISSSDSSIEVVQRVSSDSSDQTISVDSLDDWLSGSETFSDDSSYQPSEDLSSDCPDCPDCPDLSLDSYSPSEFESPESTPTADAPELPDSQVPAVVNLVVCQNLDLGSLSDSYSIDSDLDSFTLDCNPNNTKTNLEILEEKRKELDSEWDNLEFAFKQRFSSKLRASNFSVQAKYYKEGTQKRLEIANKWWKLINKYTVPQPVAPKALEL